MTVKDRLRALDRRYFDGALRRWMYRNTILGGHWGDYLDDVTRLSDGAVVLDLGAGEADLRARLPRARYIALDRGIGHAGWDYSKLDVVADATAIPLAGASVDLIVCKQVLEHIPEPVRLLEEVRRVLHPGGRILLSTNQSWPQHQQPYDFFRFTSFGLRWCFERAGLEVERMEAMGGAFSCALFQATQVLAPHLWARSERGRRLVAALLRPLSWLIKALVPLVTALDRLDLTKDNTLGWFVFGRAPSREPRPEERRIVP